MPAPTRRCGACKSIPGLDAEGCKNLKLVRGIAAGERSGRVDIDHGDTTCKTPYTPEYLLNLRLVAKLK
jgi:hypothetical protein